MLQRASQCEPTSAFRHRHSGIVAQPCNGPYTRGESALKTNAQLAVEHRSDQHLSSASRSGANLRDKRVVIVGGGFAGMTCARRLERELDADWDVFLLSRSNLLTYNPLLSEVVGGSLLPGHAVAPLRLMLSRTRIRMVTVSNIDVTAQTVAYSGVVDGTLRYDHLVLTMGMAANMGLVPGMDVNALPLKTIGDALHLRNQLLRRMEEATLTVDATRRAWLMTFVVIGGGFSGVETAGEIIDFVGSAYRYYRNLVREDVRVILVHDGERLLPASPPTLGAYALESLRHRGVDIRLNARAESVHSGVVRLRDGDQLTAATVVSTIGVAPHRFVVASCDLSVGCPCEATEEFYR